MNETTEKRCRWAGSTSPRMTRGHLVDCEGRCDGCEPCPERHCQVCGKEHVTVDGRGVDETCASCIGEARNDLNLIGTLSARLLGEAIRRGINSEATMLNGPAGDPEAWGYRRMSALAGRIDGAWLEDCRDELHPLWVVGTWEMLVRDTLDQPSAERLTLTEARAYLDGHLTRLAHLADFAFDELSRDLRACRGHLEDVLAEGEREVRGAPCIKCERPLLRDDQDDEESWWCARCKRRSNSEQYRLAVAVAYRANAKKLPVVDLAERINVPAGTIRRWAAKSERIEGTKIVTVPPLLHWVGLDQQGRKVYKVADAERLRDKVGADEVA